MQNVSGKPVAQLAYLQQIKIRGKNKRGESLRPVCFVDVLRSLSVAGAARTIAGGRGYRDEHGQRRYAVLGGGDLIRASQEIGVRR